MPDYIMLCRFTEKGVANIKESPKRIKNVKEIAESAGGKVKAMYAVLGRFDTVVIFDLPDDETMARISLQISSLGNVHIESLRAFNEDQFIGIINKIS